jgi:subtilisin family serine protease
MTDWSLLLHVHRRNFAGGADEGNATDCDGHGTHVAGTAAGRSVGMAKEAAVVAVRVLDCSGSGRISDVIAGAAPAYCWGSSCNISGLVHASAMALKLHLP